MFGSHVKHNLIGLQKRSLILMLCPNRLISRAPGLKLVVETLFSSLRPIGNIVLICCAFFIVFGILGVQVKAKEASLQLRPHFNNNSFHENIKILTHVHCHSFSRGNFSTAKGTTLETSQARLSACKPIIGGYGRSTTLII